MKKNLQIKDRIQGSGETRSFDSYLRDHIERIIRATEDPIETIDLLLKFSQENNIELIYESVSEIEPGFIIAHALKINGARIQNRANVAPIKKPIRSNTGAGTVSLRVHR